ncbi:MAG: cobalamin-dependent protein [Deltaproteobacteria bacterium]|nr:cobalamin-dependent protein [Deltaproteobacteria bacterium]MBW2726874.1 cobalamin-dependent protein [Deltaproteobacteria bacterium]
MTTARPVRILLAILGLDQHEAGAFAVARLLRDAGMEVIYLGRFGTPETVVASALDEGVDIIGLSCHSWEYLYYLDELLELLRSRELDVPVVVGGSVLCQDDKNEIEAKGVAATFGPGSDAGEIVQQIRSLAEARGAA